MTIALPRRGLKVPRWLRPNVPWTITWAYLSLVLFLPLAGMLLKAVGVGPAGFWEAATSKLAVSTYLMSFGMAAAASLINGGFGLLIAWALIRCRFPGQRQIGRAHV